MKKQSKRLVSFALAMLFVLSLVPMCIASALEGVDALEIGVSYTVTEDKLVTFTPDHDGVYRFYSSGNGDIDPYAALYASEEDYNMGNSMSSNDDYEDLDFSIDRYLTAGVEYVLNVCAYGWDEMAEYYVEVEEIDVTLDELYFEYETYSLYEGDSNTFWAYYSPWNEYAELEWS